MHVNTPLTVAGGEDTAGERAGRLAYLMTRTWKFFFEDLYFRNNNSGN